MKPRGCRPEEVAQVAGAATAMFRPGALGGRDMAAAYPLLFDPRRAENLRVIGDEAQSVLAHAGFVLLEARLDGPTARVACFGAVFTHPDHRQRGLAGRVVADAVACARRQSAGLGLVSGSGPLYARQGFTPLPPAIRYRPPPAARPAGLTVSPAGPSDIPALAALYGIEAVGFSRSSEEWAALLRAGAVFHSRGAVYLVRREGRPQAYLAVDEVLRDGRMRALEVAGDRHTVADALPSLTARLGAPVDLVGPSYDAALAGIAAARGWPRDDVGFPFSAVVWDTALSAAPVPWYGLNYV